ncbi:hypothetical protein N9N67_12300, partial [Bacteriovoracaceae bacterium]|nr:hypothetical protein [Bacteriovoracaceae bacterium]
QFPIMQQFENYIDQIYYRNNLIKQVKTEFIKNSTPSASGAYNIAQLLKSILAKKTAKLSSYSKIYDSFLCGNLNMRNGSFRQNMPSTLFEKNFIDKQILTSKKIMRGYLK